MAQAISSESFIRIALTNPLMPNGRRKKAPAIHMTTEKPMAKRDGFVSLGIYLVFYAGLASSLKKLMLHQRKYADANVRLHTQQNHFASLCVASATCKYSGNTSIM